MSAILTFDAIGIRHGARHRMKRTFSLTMFSILFAVVVATGLASDAPATPVDARGWHEDFEQYETGKPLFAQSDWRHGRPDRQDEATAIVVGEGAVQRERAVAIFQDAPTNRVFFIDRELPAQGGVVWVDARIKTAKKPIARTALTIRDDQRAATHVAFAADGRNVVFSTVGRPYWRVFRDFPCAEARWYRLTECIDFRDNTWSLWVDGKLHSADLPLLQGARKVNGIRIAACGTKDDSALIDGLYVGPMKPAGIGVPRKYPQRETGHLFRFALFGDPQIGFGDRTPPHTLDVIRLKAAIRQAEAAGCELVLCCGDLVHQVSESATTGLIEAVSTLQTAKWYPVSGNHDPDAWYREHMRRELDYSFEYKGVAFMGMKTWAEKHQGRVTPQQLAWLESQLQTARDKGNETIIWCHVTPYGPNPKGWWVRDGQEEMLRLCRQYRVLAVLAGHFHRELWHFARDGTHHVIAPGITLSRGECGWVVYDVYPDRVVQHFKPLWNVVAVGGKSEDHVVVGPLVFARYRTAQE
jgi:hypothetical protein